MRPLAFHANHQQSDRILVAERAPGGAPSGGPLALSIVRGSALRPGSSRGTGLVPVKAQHYLDREDPLQVHRIGREPGDNVRWRLLRTVHNPGSAGI